MNNKRGQVWGILLVAGAILLLLFLGILFAIGGATTSYVSTTILPELQGIGVVGDTNVTQSVNYTFGTLDTFIQQYTWIGGLLYMFGILAIFGLAFSFRLTHMKWLAVLWVLFTIVIVICSLFLSNIYEEFYTGTDDLATRLQAQPLLSYMILYSPGIISFISIIAGIIMFTGPTEETYA